jgi:hypothetical protein
MFPSIYHSSAGRNFWGQDERKRRGEERRPMEEEDAMG